MLEADRARAVLDPLGGRLASLQVRGHELLAPVRERRTQAGCYPMVPWAGRLDHGRFTFAGTEHRLPATMGPHAIHGVATDLAWTPTGPGHLDLDLGPHGPLGGRAEVDYRLTEQSITATLAVTATDQPMPAVLGWHPCFDREVAGHPDRLDFHATFMWARRDDHIPSGDTVPVPPGPWDDCFGGVAAPPTISWGDALSVRLDAPTQTWVVFDERDDIVCVEPQTDTPNAFNLSGGTVLQPGDRLALPLTISWDG